MKAQPIYKRLLLYRTPTRLKKMAPLACMCAASRTYFFWKHHNNPRKNVPQPFSGLISGGSVASLQEITSGRDFFNAFFPVPTRYSLSLCVYRCTEEAVCLEQVRLLLETPA